MRQTRPKIISEKLLLKWNDFHDNISGNNKELREDSDFSDGLNVSSNSLMYQENLKQKVENEILKVYNTETCESSIENTLLEMEEIEKAIESMVKKRVSGWTCKVCEKVSVRKDNLKKHAEVHIEDIKRPCLTCGKIFKSQDSLSVHRAASLECKRNQFDQKRVYNYQQRQNK